MDASDKAFVSERATLHNELYGMHPFSVGKDISAREREELFDCPDERLAENTSLTYGETPLETLAKALFKIRRTFGGLRESGGTFVDIGSGTGKPVFAAALLHRWDRCIGVELMPGLHEAALEILEQWEGGMPFLPRGSKHVQYRIPADCRSMDIDLRCQDATKDTSWAEEADVGFACSTCFDEPMMAAMTKAAEGMKPGSWFITSGNAMESPLWEVVDEESQTMSWGEATIYIHRRREVPASAASDSGAPAPASPEAGE